MITRQAIRSFFAGVLALAASSLGHSADTDLFGAVPPSGLNAPRILMVIDTGAAFSASNDEFRCGIDSSGNVYTTTATVVTSGPTKNSTLLDKTNGGVEQCALYTVIKSLDTSTTTLHVGVMFFNSGMKSLKVDSSTKQILQTTTGVVAEFEQKCPTGANAIGGCLSLPIVPLTAHNQKVMLDWIKNWDISGNNNYNIKAPSDRGDGATMQEAWAYFNGRTGISTRDYANELPGAGCANKYVIFIGNAWNTQASPKDKTTDAASALKALAGTHTVSGTRATPTAIVPDHTSRLQITRNFSCGTNNYTHTTDGSEGKGGWAMNWARYMFANGITTFTVGIVGQSCDKDYVAQMSLMGDQDSGGGGSFFSTNSYEGLITAFNTLLGQIQSVNSVFAAVSLPVSVNTQGSYLNQVFVGMFRPAKSFLPRWTGNLKQYKLGMSEGRVRLQDADSKNAINALTGFITECARSFWTPTITNSYWALTPQGGCLGISSEPTKTATQLKTSDHPDGNIVEKGAQSYAMRCPGNDCTAGLGANRVMKTCSTSMSGCTSLTDFNTSNGAVTSALSNDIINWGRGTNVDNDNLLGTTVYRPSVHGDVVHSRPVPLNHGTDSVPNIVVYYGANDGTLRAVNGNRTRTFTVSAGVEYAAGAELWSFMPPEFYTKISRLKINTTTVAYPLSTSTNEAPKDYGMDGPITAYQSGGTAWVYATMRRGGRAIYAFNVSSPASPALLWKRGCPNSGNDTDCTTGYSQIGQTWSSLKPMLTIGTGTTPLMITGGGYDNCEDFDALASGGKNHSCVRGTISSTPAASEASATRGNRIYVINAETGAVVKSFGTERAVIGDVTLARDENNKVLWGWASDMGGNVYRINFTNLASDDWTITRIAALGCSTPAGCTDAVANRKFFFAPSVATSDTISVAQEPTFYILVGSGDREKPTTYYASSNSVQNYFYMFKDKPTDSAWFAGANATTCGGNYVCMNPGNQSASSLYEITTAATPTDAQLAGKPLGWALKMDPTEQVVTSALTIFGVVTFSTHQPPVTEATACVNSLGTTRVYNISYLNAESANGTGLRYEDVSGDGLPPSPVAGRVQLDDGTEVPFCIGCSKDSPLEGAPPLSLTTFTQPKGRLYWYIEK